MKVKSAMNKLRKFRQVSQRLFDRLVIWRDKLQRGRTFTETSNGRFRVEYFEGGKTHALYWNTAKEMAQIFGGSIYHIPTGKKLTSYYSIQELTG